tara:strand:- start:940 stop:1119 length:180 start_codon:yes stop_codon:yes gene_type:complete
MLKGKQKTTGEQHQDAFTSLMALTRLLARQATAELTVASKLSSSPHTAIEETDDAKTQP